MQELITIVLAAGKSTRIQSVSNGGPKPLIEIEGESILSRNLRWLSGQGIEVVWINLHHQPEVIPAIFGDGHQYGLSLKYVYEPTILGTAGAVRNIASQARADTFLVVYGDNLLSLDLPQFYQSHHSHKAAVSVAVFDQCIHPHSGIAGGKVELDENNYIRAFREGITDSASSLVNAGVYLMQADVVGSIPEEASCDFGRDVFPKLLETGKPLYGYVLDGYCLGIDTPESYERVVDMIQRQEVQLV